MCHCDDGAVVELGADCCLDELVGPETSTPHHSHAMPMHICYTHVDADAGHWKLLALPIAALATHAGRGQDAAVPVVYICSGFIQ